MKTLTINFGNNTQQLADMQEIKIAAHNMAGAALDVTKNGSQGYDQYLTSKQEFESTVDNYFKNYKYCQIA